MKLSLTMYIFFSVLCFPVLTTAESNNQVYSKHIVRNRAVTGFTGSGTAIYNYRVHDEYTDELSDEEKGNFELTGKYKNVREVYNHVEVKQPIRNSGEEITIGVIKANSGKKVNVIDNSVSVKGEIAGNAKNITLGTVKIRGSRVRRISNHVRIEGGLHAE